MLRACIAAFSSVVMLLLAPSTNASLEEDLAVSPSDKAATTWADMKTRAVTFLK